MFEIPDDDENFWEDLPLEDITNSKTPVKDGSGGVKRLSSEILPTPSCKKLRSIPVKSPDATSSTKDIQNQTNHQKDWQHQVRPNHRNQEIELLSPIQHQMRSSHRHQDIELLSPIQPSSRVPAVSQHIVTPENKTPVIHNTRQHQTKSGLDSPLQTPVRARRKFPGPAGLLPKISQGSIRDNPQLSKQVISTSPEINQQQDDSVILSSQSGEDVFNEIAWQTLLSDLGEEGQKLLTQFSIVTSLQKARKKLLPKGKVPLVIAVIETIDWQGNDPSVCLKDKSGKIHGTVHQSLMKEHHCELQPGTVVVLRQVSVISPTARNHYLNVTPANVVAIYSNMSDGLKTIRSVEKNKPLNSVLQNIDSYISDDINTRRKSGSYEPKTPCQRGVHQQNSSTPFASIQNRKDNLQGTCQSNKSFQTPQRSQSSHWQSNSDSRTACSSSIQNPVTNKNIQSLCPSNQQTPQRPQSSNKFKFVKTPIVLNSGCRDVTTPNMSDRSIANHSSSNFHINNTVSKNSVERIPSIQDNISVRGNNSAITSGQQNLPDKAPSNKITSGLSRNLCSTDFNANKIRPNNVPYNTPALQNSDGINRISNSMFQNKTSETVTRQSFDSDRMKNGCDVNKYSATFTNSSVKNGFRFKTSSKSPEESKQFSDKFTACHDSRTKSITSSNKTIMKAVKPASCFEAESLWQDDLSDDLLSQLSEEMM